MVPPAQAEGMRTALDATGNHCELDFFEGEGHGFRRADTLTACLEAELAFYRRDCTFRIVWGYPFTPPPVCEAFSTP